MEQFTVRIVGSPPAKNEARSRLAAGHPHADTVRQLLEEVGAAVPAGSARVHFGPHPIALEVRAWSPDRPRTDATNILGGVADVLESKVHRGALSHLGEPADVALHDNDRQIEQAASVWEPSEDGQSFYEVIVRPR